MTGLYEHSGPDLLRFQIKSAELQSESPRPGKFTFGHRRNSEGDADDSFKILNGDE